MVAGKLGISQMADAQVDLTKPVFDSCPAHVQGDPTQTQ